MTEALGQFVGKIGPGIAALLPGMIIRQRGKIVTLVTADRRAVDRTTYLAGNTTANSITNRFGDVIERDNIQSQVLYYHGGLGDEWLAGPSQKIVELVSHLATTSQGTGECLKTVSEAVDRSRRARMDFRAIWDHRLTCRFRRFPAALSVGGDLYSWSCSCGKIGGAVSFGGLATEARLQQTRAGFIGMCVHRRREAIERNRVPCSRQRRTLAIKRS